MVTTRLIGRMGNQMFQIASAIGYATKHKMPYWIPKQSINERIWPAFFKHFPGEPEEYHKYFMYKEPEHSYTEIPFHQDIMLEGYFQSEKYFDHCRPYIINAFQIPYKKLEGFVSIHVRRGDYVTQFPDKHPAVTFEYIKEAVLLMIEKGYKDFVVCSDDLKWCRTMFKALELYGAVFSYSAGHEPIEDLAMMSCCEHNIISNSSFSWWSAWLNQNPDKIVIAPKIWFGKGNDNLSTKDICPESWIKL
jgi:Glycosyl transferase family 11